MWELSARFAADDREPNLTKVALSWSSGKDSAWTLRLLRERPDIEVVALITTFNSEANRVAMHAVRRALVEAQADAVRREPTPERTRAWRMNYTA